MDPIFCSPSYSCALCENLSSLSAECCCTDAEDKLFPIHEEKLLKRSNLQIGDKVCSKHLDKIRSGIIFGGSGCGCCAPFHLGPLLGKRLRPVPKVWRNFFVKSDLTSKQHQRYMPALQICDQCYNITMDIILSADKGDDDDTTGSDYDVIISSPQNRYTSPRKWVSSLAVQCMNGSSAGSTWSLSSARSSRPQPTGDILSLYAAQRESLGHPPAIPDSIRRYFRSKSRGSGPVISGNEEDSFSNISTDNCSIGKPFLKRVSSASLNLKSPTNERKESEERLCFKLKDNDDVSVSSASVSLDGRQSPECSNAILKRQVSKISSVSDESTGEITNKLVLPQTGSKSDESILDPPPNNDVVMAVNHDFLVPNQAAKKIDNMLVKASDVEPDVPICSVHIKCDMGENPSNISYVPTETFSDVEQERTTFTYMDQLAESLAVEVVSFVLNRYSSKNSKQADQQVPLRKAQADTFAGALAHSIVQYVLYKSADKAKRRSTETQTAKPTEALSTFGDVLATTILRNVTHSLGRVKTCTSCGDVLMKECANLVGLAQRQAEVITSTALKEVQVIKGRHKSENETPNENDLSEIFESYSESPVSAETENYFSLANETNEKLISSWIKDKQCFRSVLSVRVSDYANINTLPNKSEKSVTACAKADIEINPKTVECYIEDWYPITRSFSNGFLNVTALNATPMPKIRRSTSLDSFFLLLCTAATEEEIKNTDTSRKFLQKSEREVSRHLETSIVSNDECAKSFISEETAGTEETTESDGNSSADDSWELLDPNEEYLDEFLPKHDKIKEIDLKQEVETLACVTEVDMMQENKLNIVSESVVLLPEKEYASLKSEDDDKTRQSPMESMFVEMNSTLEDQLPPETDDMNLMRVDHLENMVALNIINDTDDAFGTDNIHGVSPIVKFEEENIDGSLTLGDDVNDAYRSTTRDTITSFSDIDPVHSEMTTELPVSQDHTSKVEHSDETDAPFYPVTNIKSESELLAEDESNVNLTMKNVDTPLATDRQNNSISGQNENDFVEKKDTEEKGISEPIAEEESVNDVVSPLAFKGDSLAKVLTRRRRATQFMRAASDAVLVRKNKLLTAREEKRGDPEDDDVAEAFCCVMDSQTPRFLRWTTNNNGDNNSNGKRWNSILKTAIIISVVGVVVIASWKYFVA